MINILHRRGRDVSSLILGAWLCVLSIGIAHACGLDGMPLIPHGPPTVQVGDRGVVTGSSRPTDHDTLPESVEVCGEEIPLVTKIQPHQDPPEGQSLHVAALLEFAPGLGSMPVPRAATSAHPASGVPLSIRFLRLRL